MSELAFSIALTRGNKPVTDASSVLLDLSMPGMFMGNNRPILKKVNDGRYEGSGVIIRCLSGKKTWQAEVAVTRANKTSVVDFLFEVQ